MFITPEELLAGKDLTHDVVVPNSLLQPTVNGQVIDESVEKKVKLKPLTVQDVQLIAKAAKDDEVLTSILMIQKALIEPKLKQNEISGMHSGLVRFLIDQINRISGLTTDDDDVQQLANAPIVQAFFILAKEFNWTPEQVKNMTVGQILGYLELLNQSKKSGVNP